MKTKERALSLMDVLLNRDELVKAQLRASFARRSCKPSMIDEALEEAFKKAQQEWAGYIKDHADKVWGARLQRKYKI